MTEKKPWLKATLKEIKKLDNKQTFIIEDLKKGEVVFSYMVVYEAKIYPDGSLDKLKCENYGSKISTE